LDQITALRRSDVFLNVQLKYMARTKMVEETVEITVEPCVEVYVGYGNNSTRRKEKNTGKLGVRSSTCEYTRTLTLP
jgi:hypothetical protein